MADSSGPTGGQTVRFKRQDMSQSEERIAAKIEKMIKKSKDFRQPRTRKRKQCDVRFLDDCGRPIPERPRRSINKKTNSSKATVVCSKSSNGKINYVAVYRNNVCSK